MSPYSGNFPKTFFIKGGIDPMLFPIIKSGDYIELRNYLVKEFAFSKDEIDNAWRFFIDTGQIDKVSVIIVESYGEKMTSLEFPMNDKSFYNLIYDSPKTK